MKFEEILPALREGKKIRRKWWWEEHYIVWNKYNEIVASDTGTTCVFGIDDFTCDDWEIFKKKKKVKLRDLTKEQYEKWVSKNCDNYDGKCNSCIFQKVYCEDNPNIDRWWVRNKDLYSDKFLDQEIEIEE